MGAGGNSARGHILLEDIPGVGKTTMALAFSRVLSLSCSRVQFTPDVLPSDVTGYSVPDSAGGMRYQPGAVLCNLFLADELNRATSRTQSALLEAMEEGQVTVDGVSHPLPKPFTVIATQNPYRRGGHSAAPRQPDGQVYGAAVHGLPQPQGRGRHGAESAGRQPLHDLIPLMTREDLTAIQDTVEETYLSDSVVNYIVSLIGATRSSPRHPSGRKPPCDAGCHRHGEIRRPASGTGLRDPGGREGGLRPHHRPPPDFIPQSGSTGKAAAGGIAGHPCRRSRPPASLT